MREVRGRRMSRIEMVMAVVVTIIGMTVFLTTCCIDMLT